MVVVFLQGNIQMHHKTIAVGLRKIVPLKLKVQQNNATIIIINYNPYEHVHNNNIVFH